MITRPHGVAEQIFWILSKDIIETKFQSKYERNWMHISPKLKLSRFMCFNKLIIHGFLCCSLFLEWVHLGANALGIQLVSLIPSKYLSFRKIWGPPWIHISDQYLHCLLTTGPRKMTNLNVFCLISRIDAVNTCKKRFSWPFSWVWVICFCLYCTGRHLLLLVST